MPSELTALLMHVQAFAKAHASPWYLVGGWLRDQLLDRPTAYVNVDFTVPHEALALSRALAQELHGAFVLLDETCGSARNIQLRFQLGVRWNDSQ